MRISNSNSKVLTYNFDFCPLNFITNGIILTMSKLRFKVTPAVFLILRKDDQILLSRRFNTGFRDGYYSLVSGHFDGGESARAAMSREAKEEAGINIDPQYLEFVHIINKMSDDGERIDIFFEAKKWVGEPVCMEPDKCDDLGWFDINNLPPNMVTEVKQAIECYQKGITYSEFGW